MRAIREMRACIALQSDYPNAQNSLGFAAAAQRRRRGSGRCISSGHNISSDDFDARNNLGLAFMQSGDGQGAIREFQAAIRLRPHDSGYIGNLGAAYLQIAGLSMLPCLSFKRR